MRYILLTQNVKATPIIDKVVVMRGLIIPFCVAKREGDRTAGVVVGSSLSVFLQFDRSDSLALLRKEEGDRTAGVVVGSSLTVNYQFNRRNTRNTCKCKIPHFTLI